MINLDINRMNLNAIFQSWRLLPCAWLLFIQFLLLVMTLFSKGYSAAPFFLWGLSVCALILVGRVIKQTAVWQKLGHVCIAVATLCLSILLFGHYDIRLHIFAHICEIIAYLSAIYGLLRYMFADRYLTKDELFAAAAVFTLCAWTFAFAYNVCQLLIPNSFANSTHEQVFQSWLDILFFSFSLQSATGLSNLMPLHPAVKALAILQMFIGVMYLAIIVSRLIALRYIQASPPDESK